MSDRQPSHGELLDAAQRAAGVLAARARGDADGVQVLMSTFADDRALAGGCLLLAQLSLGLAARETGRPLTELVQELTSGLSAVPRDARP